MRHQEKWLVEVKADGIILTKLPIKMGASPLMPDASNGLVIFNIKINGMKRLLKIVYLFIFIFVPL